MKAGPICSIPVRAHYYYFRQSSFVYLAYYTIAYSELSVTLFQNVATFIRQATNQHAKKKTKSSTAIAMARLHIHTASHHIDKSREGSSSVCLSVCRVSLAKGVKRFVQKFSPAKRILQQRTNEQVESLTQPKCT